MLLVISEHTQDRLKRLEKIFPPNQVRISLGLDVNSTPEEVACDLATVLEQLEAFIANGHSTEGLGFQYASVKRFTAARNNS